MLTILPPTHTHRPHGQLDSFKSINPFAVPLYQRLFLLLLLSNALQSCRLQAAQLFLPHRQEDNHHQENKNRSSKSR